MLTPSHRTLVQALAVSLLLHTALLASAVKSYPVRLEVAAVTINAVLRERGAAGALLSAPPTRASGELARPSAPEAHGDVARKAQAEAALAVEPRENSPAAPNALDAPGSAGRPAGVAAIGSAPSPGSLSGALSSAAPSAASGAGNDGVSADDLRQSGCRWRARHDASGSIRRWRASVAGRVRSRWR